MTQTKSLLSSRFFKLDFVVFMLAVSIKYFQLLEKIPISGFDVFI
jgi:hypothetical protein